MRNFYTTCNRKSRHKSHAIGTRFRDMYNNGSIHHTTECGNYRIVFNRFNPRSSCASNVPACSVLGELCGDELRMAKALHKHQEHIAQPKVEPAELHQPQVEPAVQQPAQKMSTGKKVYIGVGVALAATGLGWLVWKKTR